MAPPSAGAPLHGVTASMAAIMAAAALCDPSASQQKKRKVVPYRSAWVRRAEEALRNLLASPVTAPPTPAPSPLRYGADLCMPLSVLSEVVAQVARANGWAMYGPDSPATSQDLVTALARANKKVERLHRAKYRGRTLSGLFVWGLDVAEPEPESDAEAEEGSKDKEGFTWGRDAAKPMTEQQAALHTCGCGYRTIDNSALQRHAQVCQRAFGPPQQVKLSTRPDASDQKLLVRIYRCQNQECVACNMRKFWVSRQAAHNHKRLRGCLVASERCEVCILP